MKFDSGESVSTYAYVLAPNSASLLPKGIDWLPLSPIPLSQSHIRYHEVELMRRGNSDFYDSLNQGEYPAAVVLVNVDNTNDLAVPININRIPVIMVSAQVGKSLREVLYNSGEKRLLCKIYPIAPMAAELDVSLQRCKYSYPFLHCMYMDWFVFPALDHSNSNNLRLENKYFS